MPELSRLKLASNAVLYASTASRSAAVSVNRVVIFAAPMLIGSGRTYILLVQTYGWATPLVGSSS
jgi:hypothetical protein